MGGIRLSNLLVDDIYFNQLGYVETTVFIKGWSSFINKFKHKPHGFKHIKNAFRL